MLYNTDLTFWKNARESMRERTNGGPVLCVHDGMIGDGYVVLAVLARFPSQQQAEQTLRDSGFRKIGDGRWKA